MTILQIARNYVGLGYSVVPIALDGSKSPTVKWQDYQTRIATDAELIKLFPSTRGTVTTESGPGESNQTRTIPGTEKPLRGIALAHGKISGNSEVLDFDNAEFYDLWSDRVIAGGFGDVLIDLVHVRTPTGGRHIYYRCTEPVEGNQKLAYALLDIPDHATRGKRANGSPFAAWDGNEYTVHTVGGIDKAEDIAIETRGEGGYTIAPGSPAAVHPTGRLYGKIAGPSFQRAVNTGAFVITPDVRAALLDIARSLCQKPAQEIRPSTTAPSRRAYDSLKPGDDYNLRASQADILALLESAGWTVTGQSGRVIQLARPGKSKGNSGTLGHDGHNVFHSFTTTGELTADSGGQGKAFAPFTLYAMIRHNGDFTAAARDLAAQGYGDTRTLAEIRRNSMLGKSIK